MALSPIQLHPSMSQEQMINALNDNFAQLEAENRTKVVKDESGVNRIILGKDPNGVYGLKISQVGKDVMTAAEKDLVLNSANNLFKIVASGTTSFVAPGAIGTTSSVSITHSLGYNPIVMAFVSITGATGTAQPMPFLNPQISIDPNPGTIAHQIAFECVGGDTITFFQRNLSKSASWTNYIRYYIIRETANTA